MRNKYKLKLLAYQLIAFALIMITSCDDDKEITLPEIDLEAPFLTVEGIGTQSYDHGAEFDDEATYGPGARWELISREIENNAFLGQVGDTVVMTIDVTAPGVFKALSVSIDGGSATSLSEGENPIEWTYILKTEDVDTQKVLRFTAEDETGNTRFSDLLVAIDPFVAPPAPDPLAVELPYTAAVVRRTRIIEVAAGDFSTSPQLSLRTGVTHTTTELIADPTISEDIDLMFDYDFGGEAGNGWIMSPASFNVHFANLWNIGADPTDTDQQAWTKLNNTKLVMTTLTVDDFEAIAALPTSNDDEVQEKIKRLTQAYNSGTDIEDDLDLGRLNFIISEGAGIIFGALTQDQNKALVRITVSTSVWVPHVELDYIITEL